MKIEFSKGDKKLVLDINTFSESYVMEVFFKIASRIWPEEPFFIKEIR